MHSGEDIEFEHNYTNPLGLVEGKIMIVLRCGIDNMA